MDVGVLRGSGPAVRFMPGSVNLQPLDLPTQVTAVGVAPGQLGKIGGERPTPETARLPCARFHSKKCGHGRPKSEQEGSGFGERQYD